MFSCPLCPSDWADVDTAFLHLVDGHKLRETIARCLRLDPDNVVLEILKDRADEFQSSINRHPCPNKPHSWDAMKNFVLSMREALRMPRKRVTLEMSYVSTIEKGGRAYELSETEVMTEHETSGNGDGSVTKQALEDRAAGGGFDVPSDTKHFGGCTIEMRKKPVTMVRDGEQRHFIADTNDRRPEHNQMDELYFDDSYIPQASDSIGQYTNDTYYQETVARFYGLSDSEDDATA